MCFYVNGQNFIPALLNWLHMLRYVQPLGMLNKGGLKKYPRLFLYPARLSPDMESAGGIKVHDC